MTLTERFSEEAFGRLCRSLSSEVFGAQPGLVSGWFAILRDLYAQPHRAYHTREHIGDLLWKRSQYIDQKLAGYALEVETAIWFHDAIYDIGGPKGANEDASALLCRAFMRTLDLPDGFVNRVLAAIDATKHDGRDLGGSFTKAADVTSMLMVDLDLAGFADPWSVFEVRNGQIRAELSRYTDEQYRVGRIAFLGSLLARKIYWVLTDLEKPARANIERHMADLLAAR